MHHLTPCFVLTLPMFITKVQVIKGKYKSSFMYIAEMHLYIKQSDLFSLLKVFTAVERRGS